MSAAEQYVPNETERFIAALDLGKHRDTKERRESLALLKAIRLAPSLEVCEALLQGEKVHSSRLDPHWVKAYGRS
jgi:hypothetical protein